MENKITDKKVEKYYKNTYLIISTIGLYFLILILKPIFYNLFDFSLKNMNEIYSKLINITYQIFAITMSINFFIKNKKSTLKQFLGYLKTCRIGALTIIVYSLTSILELAVLYYANVDVKAMTVISKTIYLISFEVLIMAIIALINHESLEKELKDIKKNHKKYYKENFKYYLFALGVMMISNLIINMIQPGIAGNEENVRNTLNYAPVYMFTTAVLFAPFTEEMVFRKSIRNIIKDDLTFIITSGLVFGGLHVVGNITTFADVLYIIPYSAPGIAFAYMLVKTKNIFVPMGIHFMHNGIMMSLQILLLLLT